MLFFFVEEKRAGWIIWLTLRIPKRQRERTMHCKLEFLTPWKHRFWITGSIRIIPVLSFQAVLRKLLPHQKMALNWMIKRENTTELPPFWECIKVNRDYFNTATRKRCGQRPSGLKGGILADDMGLGKTLTTIALILTNHKNEKPMFGNKKVVFQNW